MTFSSRTSQLRIASLVLLPMLSGCFGMDVDLGVPDRTTNDGVGLTIPSGPNIMRVSVNGDLCSAGSYLNKPCVKVTICPPSDHPEQFPNEQCQTIKDILLDTGSYGLRVFKSVLKPSLQAALAPVERNGKPVAECVSFADQSKDWGQVMKASVVLGGEAAVETSIQVWDPSYGDAETHCALAETSPEAAGFNGILGVGLFEQDCGAVCETQAHNGMYFSCDQASGTCTPTALPLEDQVTNPVTALSVDNNGVTLHLPSVPSGGVASAEGYLVLGVGTQPNNQVQGVKTYLADASQGEFTTVFKSKTYPESFIDSGSNGLFFEAPPTENMPDCGDTESSASGWYCIDPARSFSATNTGVLGSASGPAPFQLGHLLNLAWYTNNNVFVEAGGDIDDGYQSFDWGLPFFFGRPITVGYEHKSSPLASGPYWAY
jgi:hypothetical protein